MFFTLVPRSENQNRPIGSVEFQVDLLFPGDGCCHTNATSPRAAAAYSGSNPQKIVLNIKTSSKQTTDMIVTITVQLFNVCAMVRL